MAGGGGGEEPQSRATRERGAGPRERDDEGGGAELFSPIDQRRAHEYVAEQIRRQISLHLLAPGQSLPSERDLAGLLGVGRATVQQAIGLLEAERLVVIRRGRAGGVFVADRPADELGMDYLLARLRRDRERIEAALDFRAIVEPKVAAEVAAAGGGSGGGEPALLDEARAAIDRGRRASSDAEFMGADTEFHLVLARASGNEFLVEAIERVRLVLNDALAALPESDLWHERSTAEHARIADACAAGDERAAEREMTRHIDETAHSIRALLAQLARGRR